MPRKKQLYVFTPNLYFLNAISGLFSAAYHAGAESWNFIYFYPCFMNVFSLSETSTNEANVFAQPHEVGSGTNTIQPFPWHHCHGIFLRVVQRLCHPFPKPCRYELRRAQGMWKGPGLYCHFSPSLYRDQSSWILLLKEAFLPSGRKRWVQTKTMQCHAFDSDVYAAFLFAKPGILVETLFVGMLNSGRWRMAHFGWGMHNPSSRFFSW